MGSFIMPKATYTDGPGGSKIAVPLFVQFVHGIVLHVITSEGGLFSGEKEQVGTIIAMPHLTGGQALKKGEVYDFAEKYRYKPLMRGMADVPVKGDPVMLCTVGQKQYYLGPLNTDNDVNWNADNGLKAEVVSEFRNLAKEEGDDRTTALFTNLDPASIRGESRNFMFETYNRLQKIPKPDLDNPTKGEMPTYHELHGDMMFEGRHGNSIRIGSRYNNPYTYISTGRDPENISETINDANLITMTTHGTLKAHLGLQIHPAYPSETEEKTLADFTLASDMNIENKRKISNLVKFVNKVDDVKPLLSDYNRNQIYINSSRIIINSDGTIDPSENIYNPNQIDLVPGDLILSSYNDIHLGSGRNLTVSTNKDLIIESERTYFGKNASMKNKNGELKGEPMVLGKQLVSVLKDFVKVLKQCKTITQVGPQPLMDSANVPLSESRILMKPLEDKIDTILSYFHFIESNDTEK